MPWDVSLPLLHEARTRVPPAKEKSQIAGAQSNCHPLPTPVLYKSSLAHFSLRRSGQGWGGWVQCSLSSWLHMTHIRRPAETHLSPLTALAPGFPPERNQDMQRDGFHPNVWLWGCLWGAEQSDPQAQPHCPGLAQGNPHKSLKREVLWLPLPKREKHSSSST